MTTTAVNILNEARKYIGVVQGSSTHQSIVNVYNSVKPLPQNYQVTYGDQWCDTFISFLAIKTGAVDLIGRECGVERHINIFKNLGIWIEDGSITPKPGDIITFTWNINSQPNDGFADHIGIVESVSNGKITTIEGNSSSAVRRRSYNIGHSEIRGYARPSYQTGAGANDSPYNGGSLVNAGRSISQDNIRLVIQHAKKYNIRPSFLIGQMFIESHWGDPNTSIVGSVDNNWSGISEPFKAPADLNINMRRGSARPGNEGGYYVHFETLNDYFKAYTFILSNRNGCYKLEGTNSIDAFCKGLFRIGGAAYDYAASGYQHYLDMLIPTYNAIKKQNPSKLEAIDASNTTNDGTDNYNPGTNESFTRNSEIGTFYPNTTLNVRDYPSTQGNVLAQYTTGESINYDSYVVNGGYVWISYVASSGARRYVAWRVNGGEKFGTIPSGTNEGFTPISETGTFYPNTTLNVRDYPGTQGNVVAQYTIGESVVYDSYVTNGGYVWISYVASSGARRYVAWRVQGGEKFGTIPSGTNEGFTPISETGTFYPNTTLNVRDYP
ncbi:SH3 domain-containing protein, partial [Clostridium gasigenes]|uniref:SH3 domain-containing protein n=1 Tax=Clostridium gasigenes TaxID=94869 RepID=UPI001C0CFE9E